MVLKYLTNCSRELVNAFKSLIDKFADIHGQFNVNLITSCNAAVKIMYVLDRWLFNAAAAA